MLRLKFDPDKWRLSNINRYFQLCDSYPSDIIVPKNLKEAYLLMSAQFRKNGRVPVSTWRHKNGSVLSHSSFPTAPCVDLKVPTLPSKEDDERVIQTLILSSISSQNNQSNNQLNNSGNNIIIDDSGEDKNNNNNNASLLVKRPSRRVFSSLRSTRKATAAPINRNTNTSTNTLNNSANISIINSNNLNYKKEDISFYIIEVFPKNDQTKQKDFVDQYEHLNNTTNDPDLLSTTIGKGTLYYDSFNDLKECYRRIHKLCATYSNSTDEHRWLSAVDSTHWIDHLQNVMYNTSVVVDLLSSGSSVYLSCFEESFVFFLYCYPFLIFILQFYYYYRSIIRNIKRE